MTGWEEYNVITNPEAFLRSKTLMFPIHIILVFWVSGVISLCKLHKQSFSKIIETLNKHNHKVLVDMKHHFYVNLQACQDLEHIMDFMRFMLL